MGGWRLHTPDEILLRRFGWVRAVGGGAYIVAVLVLLGIYGWQVWPLALGAPVLAVVTVAYFVKSAHYPRLAVLSSLVADALVLGGAIAFIGGTGSGLVLIYAIVVVSGGILLGPGAAAGFTVFTSFLGVLQLVMEEMALAPVLLHREDLADRWPILLISLAGLASVGYLTASYASRLHDLIAEAGAEFEAVRRRSRRRRSFVAKAVVHVGPPLAEVEAVAEALTTDWDQLGEHARSRMAGRLRMATSQLDGEISQLADLGVMDAIAETRPQPVLLRRVSEDCLVAMGSRLEGHTVELDVPPLKVVGDRRGARRVVYNLLENVAEHTPPGTTVRITALTTAGQGVLVVEDDGPGIPADEVRRLFAPPDASGSARVGLPLVRELCDAMGAVIRYEPSPSGGARFLVGFRLAPSAAPSPDDVTLSASED
jgi:two-component system, OmpR family, sensor kinase